MKTCTSPAPWRPKRIWTCLGALIAGSVLVLGAARAHGPVVAEIPLPSGMTDRADAEESSDPRGLPRVLDYTVYSTSRHTLSDRVWDASGRSVEVPLGRVETREYRLDRYAKRPPATPADILSHYRRQLEVIGGAVLSQSADGLTGRYLRGGLPVEVGLKVKRGGARYELTTGGPGAQDGVTGLVVEPPPRREPDRRGPGDRDGPSAPGPAHESGPGSGPHSAPVDGRSSAPSGFKMPANATLWPARGTRGMAVLLVGPGVESATAVRFGTSDGEILARKTARLRVLVPVLASGTVPVTVIYANGTEKVKGDFRILEAPRVDAAVITVPPCDGRPGGIADVGPLTSQPIRPGQMLKLTGRKLNEATHVTFTVARDEVDPLARGIDPDLVGIDFGASGKARSAPRWLDTLAANIGRSAGARPSVPGECDASNLSGYAAIRHTGDREGEVCVPPLALTGPIGLWRPGGASGDACDTSENALPVDRVPAALGHRRRH